MKIYHNPRCSKSRQTLALIEEKGADVEIIEYLNHRCEIEDRAYQVVKLKSHPF